MKYATLVITTFVFFFSCALYGQQQTSDGGYIIAGTGSSYVHGADPNTDFLVYKLSASGVKQWRKNYGGDDYEYCSHVIQTSDGGYALCGQTRSYTHGQTDFLVYRLDPAGAKLWRKNYGGISFERPRRIVQTSDGGFVVSGYTDTYTNGGRDILVYRLNAAGTKLWRKNYGGISLDTGGFIETTSDGGFILLGYSYSYTHGKGDFLLYKLDATGAKQWRRHYGGLEYDISRAVRQTSDGGYVVAGYSDSYSALPGGKGAVGEFDFLVYRLDAAGNKLWRKNYGGLKDEHCWDIHQLPGGDFILMGYGLTYTDNQPDFLAYRIDASGAKQWRRYYGGADSDWGYMACPTSDGGFLFLGDGDSYSATGVDSDLLAYRVDGSGL